VFIMGIGGIAGENFSHPGRDSHGAVRAYHSDLNREWIRIFNAGVASDKAKKMCLPPFSSGQEG
jgi:hypothetical protein